MASLIPEQRHQALLAELRTHGVLSVRELASQLGVSHMTIRRDITFLENAGKVTAVKGGVKLPGDPGLSVPLDLAGRTALELPRKRAISSEALGLIEDGMAIFLDAGTTMQELARKLITRRNLTVISNDLTVCSELGAHPEVHVIAVGGSIDPRTAATEGHLASETMRKLSVDLAFISTPGWSVSRGLSSPTEGKRDLKLTVMRVAESSILLADSTKYGQSALVKVTDLSEMDAIITDDGLRPEVRNRVRETGVELEVATTSDFEK